MRAHRSENLKGVNRPMVAQGIIHTYMVLKVFKSVT